MLLLHCTQHRRNKSQDACSFIKQKHFFQLILVEFIMLHKFSVEVKLRFKRWFSFPICDLVSWWTSEVASRGKQEIAKMNVLKVWLCKQQLEIERRWITLGFLCNCSPHIQREKPRRAIWNCSYQLLQRTAKLSQHRHSQGWFPKLVSTSWNIAGIM